MFCGNVAQVGCSQVFFFFFLLPFLPSFCFLALGECVRLMSHLLQETAGRVSHSFETVVVIPHVDCLTRGCPLGVDENILHLFFNFHKPL